MKYQLPGNIETQKSGNLDSLRGPYLSISVANAAIPNILVDEENYRKGKIVDIGPGADGRFLEHKWQGGYEDENLKPTLEGLAKIEDTLPITYETTVRSINLADKSLMKSGSFSTNGNLVPSNNWIHFVIDVTPETNYAVSGMMSIASNRFVFWNGATYIAGQNIASNNETSQLIKTPSGATRMGVNVANDNNIGLNPTGNAFALSFQVEIGSVFSPYEPFYIKTGLDGSKVVGKLDQLTPYVGLPEKVKSMDQLQQAILKGYDIFYSFNGVSSNIPISPQIVLDAVGDFVECTSRFDGSSSSSGLGLFGTVKNGALLNVFGYYASDQMWLRQNISNSAYLSWNGLPSLNSFRKIKLMVVVGGWELFVDGVSMGVKAKSSSLLINTIGRGYQTNYVKASFQDKITFNSSAGVRILENLNQLNYAKDVYIDASPKSSSQPGSVIRPVYVSYNPIGYKGREKITAFVRRGETNRYTGFIIGHDYDMSNEVYSDQYRVVGADDYIFSSGIMQLAVSNTLSEGESECVYMRQPGLANAANGFNGMVDHTGGYHGDEVMQSVNFFLNGTNIGIIGGSSFDLIPGDNFRYIQRSTMYETAKKVNDVIIYPEGHPVDCYHIKDTFFGRSGMESTNILNGFRPGGVPIEYWYHAIYCNGKMQSTKGRNENYETADYNGSGSNKLTNTGLREFYGYNESTGYSMNFTAKLIDLASQDLLCKFFTWDRSIDTKIYRQTPPFTLSLNQSYRSVMIAKHEVKD